MRRQRLSIKSLIFFVVALALFSAHAAATEHLRFKVSLGNTLSSGPVSGRLLIFMTSQTKPLEMIEPDFLNPRAVFLAGVEIHNLEQGKPVEVDPDALAFPAPFSSAPAGNYQLMAQLDVDHSYTYDGTGAGDLYSEIKAVSDLNPSAPQTIELTLTKRVPEGTVS